MGSYTSSPVLSRWKRQALSARLPTAQQRTFPPSFSFPQPRSPPQPPLPPLALSQEMLGTDCHGMMFDAAWSEAALCHAPPADRRAALAAIFSQLKPGGVLILHDAVQGPSPISPTAQLHVYERLQLSGLWTAPQYMETLTSLGFSVQEYINLTSHQAASYSALSITARAVSHDCEADEESQQAFQQMAHDYKISGMMAAKHQLGWGLFIATKSDIGAAATA